MTGNLSPTRREGELASGRLGSPSPQAFEGLGSQQRPGPATCPQTPPAVRAEWFLLQNALIATYHSIRAPRRLLGTGPSKPEAFLTQKVPGVASLCLPCSLTEAAVPSRVDRHAGVSAHLTSLTLPGKAESVVSLTSQCSYSSTIVHVGDKKPQPELGMLASLWTVLRAVGFSQ